MLGLMLSFLVHEYDNVIVKITQITDMILFFMILG